MTTNTKTIPGIFNLLSVINQITDNLQAGHYVWGGGAGAEATQGLDGETTWEVHSPDNEGEDRIVHHESAQDAAWDLLRRSGGAPLTVEMFDHARQEKEDREVMLEERAERSHPIG